MNLDLRISAVCGFADNFSPYLSWAWSWGLHGSRSQDGWLVFQQQSLMCSFACYKNIRVYVWIFTEESSNQRVHQKSSTVLAAWLYEEKRLEISFLPQNKTFQLEVSRSRRNLRDKWLQIDLWVGIGKLSRSFGRTWGGSSCNSEHNFNSEDKKSRSLWLFNYFPSFSIKKQLKIN